MKTTYHADLRARKRIGVADVSRQFAEALELGYKQSDLKGQLRKYIDKQAIVHRSSCRIYKGIVYWHNKSNVLITVIPLHQKWHKYLKLKEQR